jgi:hypothetical protein
VAALVQNNVAAQNGAVVYPAFSGYGSLDTQYTMVAYLHVVAEVYTIHQVVFIADAGSAFCMGGTADDHVLADNQQAFFSRIVEVLWFGTQDGIMMHLVPFSQAGAVQDFGARHDYTVITYFHVPFDKCKGLDSYILADFCG